MSTPDESQVARDLAAFLVTKDGYQRLSPIEGRVRSEIAKLAQEISEEVVAAHPSLRAAIAEMTHRVVSAALRDDEYLRGVVTAAVGKALGQLVAERGTDQGSDD
jgi:hypothetical protein